MADSPSAIPLSTYRASVHPNRRKKKNEDENQISQAETPFLKASGETKKSQIRVLFTVYEKKTQL